MTSSNPPQATPARDIPTALDNLEPDDLQPGTPEWGFYVAERVGYQGRLVLDTLDGLQRDLEREAARHRTDRRYPKLLVSGHKGTGKSTELNRIAAGISTVYEVITCSASEYINRDDVSARDLLFVLGGLAVDRIKQNKGLAVLEKDPDAKAALAVLSRDFPSVDFKEGEAGFSLLGIFSARLKFEGKLRTNLRSVAERRAEDLRTLVNRCFELLAAAVERPVLVIMDDLDKVERGSSGRDALFGEDFPLLLEPRVTILYTIPMDVYFDDRFTTISNHPKRHVIGHIKLWNDHRAQSRFQTGWDLLQKFIARRASLALFEPGIVERLIALSGGSFEQLRRLVWHTLNHLDFIGGDQATEISLLHAIREVRTDLVRPFGGRPHREALQRIHSRRAIEPPDDLRYLPLLAVLEYENDMPWYDVNPLLVPLIDAKEEE